MNHKVNYNNTNNTTQDTVTYLLGEKKLLQDGQHVCGSLARARASFGENIFALQSQGNTARLDQRGVCELGPRYCLHMSRRCG